MIFMGGLLSEVCTINHQWDCLMPKDFDSLFGWQNNSVFQLAEKLRSMTGVKAFENSRVVAMAATVAAKFPQTVAYGASVKALADCGIFGSPVGLAASTKGLASCGIFGSSVTHLSAFSGHTALAGLGLPSTVSSQLESALERMGGWDRIAKSVARHFSPEQDDVDVWEEEEPELEGAVAYVKDELTAGKSLEAIANQVSLEPVAPEKEYAFGIPKGVLISLIVVFIMWMLNCIWDSTQKAIASRPAIHYAERHESQLAVVVNKTGVNVRETSEEGSFSVHRFDEGVYVLLMPGRTKNRREIAYQYDDDNNPIKTGWVPPSALRMLKAEQLSDLLDGK